MPLQNYVDGQLPLIHASWLNKIDAFVTTLFADAVTPAQAMAALGFSATGIAIVTAASAATARTALGATTTGSALFTAADAAAARTAIGATAFGGSMLVAADAAAGRALLGATATGSALFTAVDAAAARAVLGGTSPYDFLVACSGETTVIAAATGVLKFVVRRSITLSAICASLNTGSSSGVVTIDVNKNGVSMFSTLLTIDVSETDSATAAVAAVLSVTTLVANDVISIDIDTAGTGAAGLKLEFVGSLT